MLLNLINQTTAPSGSARSNRSVKFVAFGQERSRIVAQGARRTTIQDFGLVARR